MGPRLGRAGLGRGEPWAPGTRSRPGGDRTPCWGAGCAPARVAGGPQLCCPASVQALFQQGRGLQQPDRSGIPQEGPPVGHWFCLWNLPPSRAPGVQPHPLAQVGASLGGSVRPRGRGRRPGRLCPFVPPGRGGGRGRGSRRCCPRPVSDTQSLARPVSWSLWFPPCVFGTWRKLKYWFHEPELRGFGHGASLWAS